MLIQIEHGGNTSSIRRRLGLGDAPLLDFSAPLNPLGPPPRAMAAARRAFDGVDRYPEPGCPRLTERLAERHGVPVDRVFVGAGTSELISLIAQSLREVLALHAREIGDPGMPLSHLIEPTYGEYRRASVLNELPTQLWVKHALGWAQDFLPRSAAGIFWTGHPNNPTGRAWDLDRLLSLVDDSQSLLTVVDEAFLGFLHDEAERTAVGAVASRDNLLVLRSMTKVYAFPGLRVGYAVASPDMVARLAEYQNPWTVMAAAEAAALAAIDDDEYLHKTVEWVASESARVLDRLWGIRGLRPAWPGPDLPTDAPPLPNYVLVSLTDTNRTSVEVHEELARRGFLVRECSNIAGLEVGSILTGPDQMVATRGHIRIGLRFPEQNDRLLDEIEEIMRAS